MCHVWMELNSMKKKGKIMDTSTKRRGSWREVDVGRLEFGARRGEKSEEECVESGNAKVEGGIAAVFIYTSSMPGVHFLTVSPGGVYWTSKEREVWSASTTTSHTEVDTGIMGQMNYPYCRSTNCDG